MSERVWTTNQKSAIKDDGDILVSASAGSGKTAVMVERVIRYVSEDLPLRRLLVLVYNNAAASELKERITERLISNIAQSAGAERAKFRRALDDVRFCDIDTVDGFCLSLVRENFEELGISPDISMAEGAELAELRERAVKELFARYYAQDDGLFARLVEMFNKKRDEEGLLNAIFKLFEYVSVDPRGEQLLDDIERTFVDLNGGRIARLIISKQKSAAKKIFEEAGRLIEPLEMDDQRERARLLEKICQTAQSVLCADTIKELCKIYSDCVLEAKISPKTQKNNPELCDLSSAVWNAHRSFVREGKELFFDYQKLLEFNAQNLEFFKKLSEVVKLFKRIFDRIKREARRYDFHDIAHLALKVVEKNGREISERYDYIFVDEYQDINPLQEFLIECVAKKNSLFMVGDTKQSIYGFRMSDPEIFLRRMARYGAGGGRNIFLNKNFRSNYDILDFVNRVFDVIMTEQSCGVDYKSAARFDIKDEQEQGKEAEKDDGADALNMIAADAEPSRSVEVHLFCEQKTAKEKITEPVYKICENMPEDDLSAEAAQGKFIAQKIKAIVGKEIAPDGKKYGYGDIAILYRGRGDSVSEILAVIRDEGIPLDCPSLKSQNAERELITLLRAADNPTDDLNLAGYLLSYFSGLREEELAKIRVAYPEAAFYQACRNYAEEGGRQLESVSVNAQIDAELSLRLREKLAFLDEVRLKSSLKNVRELLLNIVFDTHYYAYLSSTGGSALSEVSAFLASVPQNGAMTLRAFLKGYEASDKNNKPKTSAAVSSKVSVKTIHGAKGLEFPIVFMVGIDKQFNRRSATGDLLVDNSGSVGLMYFDEQKRTKSETLSHFAAKIAINNREARENMRLFYVALTRARHKMFLTGKNKERKEFDVFSEPSSYLDYLFKAVNAGSLPEDYLTIHDETPPPAQIKRRQASAFGAPDPEYVKAIKKRMECGYPHSAAAQTAQKFSATALSWQGEAQEDAQVLFIDNPRKEHGGAADLGTAHHKVMQHIDFETDCERGVIDKISELVEAGELDAPTAAKINAEDILRCLNSEIIKTAKEHVSVREKPFMMFVPLNEISDKEEHKNVSDKVLVQGVIDLLVFDEAKKTVLIVDFKNTWMRKEEIKKAYKKQLYIYETAIRNAFSGYSVKSAVYSFRSGETIYFEDRD